MRLLIVEDDQLLGDGLQRGLKLMGNAVDWVQDGGAADHALDVAQYDAVVLDLALPGEDGMMWLARWRAKGLRTSVLVLSARDETVARISALDAGADDYLVKPTELEELAAHLRALGRRASGNVSPVWSHGGLEFHPATRRTYWQTHPVELTAREAYVLELFLTHPFRILTRDFLRDKLYDWESDIESNALDVHIHNLRRKIHPNIIHTVRGAGYCLGSPDKSV